VAAVFEDEAGEFLGGILFARLEPVHGDVEFGCEFAQCLDGSAGGIRFEAADVSVGAAEIEANRCACHSNSGSARSSGLSSMSPTRHDDPCPPRSGTGTPEAPNVERTGDGGDSFPIVRN
jgi:hypothetical protein